MFRRMNPPGCRTQAHVPFFASGSPFHVYSAPRTGHPGQGPVANTTPEPEILPVIKLAFEWNFKIVFAPKSEHFVLLLFGHSAKLVLKWEFLLLPFTQFVNSRQLLANPERDSPMFLPL